MTEQPKPKKRPDTTGRLPWVRVGGPQDVFGPIKASNLYHAVFSEAPDGKVTAECGRILVGAYDMVIKTPGHWPEAFSCRDCIGRIRRSR